MSYLAAAPQALMAAASDVAGIGSSISAANAAAAFPTTAVLASAADDVSSQVAALFSSYGQGYQRLSTQLSSFHEQIVAGLNSTANSYAATEATAAQSLLNAVNSPLQQLLGQPLIGPSGPVANAVSRAVSGLEAQAQSVFAGTAGLSKLATIPTGESLAAAAVQPAAVIPVSWATAIQNFYNTYEPWVQYGFQLASYAVGWLPYIGILAPQINIFYASFEPLVQSIVFNTTDWLAGTVSFSQGLSNVFAATTNSINDLIYNEYYWIRSFFPPLPPLP